MSYRDVLLLLSRGSVQSSRGKRLMSARVHHIDNFSLSFLHTVLFVVTGTHHISHICEICAFADLINLSRRIKPGMELEAGDDMRALRGFYNQTEGITSTRAICRCKWQNKFYDKCKFWLTTLRVKKTRFADARDLCPHMQNGNQHCFDRDYHTSAPAH
jgi:hypothetical protein